MMKNHQFIAPLLLSFVLVGLLAQPVLSQVHNEAFFSYDNVFNLETDEDYVPNDPSIWDRFSRIYYFDNWGDDSDQSLLGPYLNLTTTTSFSSFDPIYNETGTSPHGLPYYIWDYPQVELQEWESWVIEGEPVSPPTYAPGFSVQRRYTPRVIRKSHAVQMFVAEINLEEDGLDRLYVYISSWDTDEADARLIAAFLKPPTPASVEEVNTADWGGFGVSDPPVGKYRVLALVHITNKFFPTRIRYVPEVWIRTWKEPHIEVGLTSKVTFTAKDDSIITFGGKEPYYWYYAEKIRREVTLYLVSEAV